MRAQAALRLWLICAAATDKASVMVGDGGFAAICQEFLSQALVCYEEEITESRKQVAALAEVRLCAGSAFVQDSKQGGLGSLGKTRRDGGARICR